MNRINYNAKNKRIATHRTRRVVRMEGDDFYTRQNAQRELAIIQAVQDGIGDRSEIAKRIGLSYWRTCSFIAALIEAEVLADNKGRISLSEIN